MTMPGEAPRVLNVREDARDRVPGSSELCAPLPTWGTLSRRLDVGSLRFRLSGLDGRLAAIMDEGYRGFVSDDSLLPDVDSVPWDDDASCIEVLRSPEARYLYLPREEGRSEEARVGARSVPDGLELWSYFFAARFDREGRRARLLLCDAADLDLSQGIENTLRFFVSAAALASGGFLLHAAGVVRSGRAWAFFGPSGAGKSTTASNAPPDAQLLGDDLLLVEHQGGRWRACGVPFRGTFARGDNAAVGAPLAMALRLVQASENSISQVPRSIQAAEILGEIPFLMDDAALRERSSVLVEKFVREVTVRRLHLARGSGYWSLLEP
jgi:hypothetical protein